METKDHTFRVNFSEDGSAKLTLQLTHVLKEYMGDFVDDTLVVWRFGQDVLLGNGRSKEEVKEDMDVFLGDSTDSFVTWLWDHLASNVEQYVDTHGSCEVEGIKAKPVPDYMDKIDSGHPVTDSDRVKSIKSIRSRHNREWKGLTAAAAAAAHPPLRSSVIDHIQNEQKTHHIATTTRVYVSPEHRAHKKADLPNERPHIKSEVSQAKLAAPRRLLQFAVREAVATTRPSNSVSESSRKRLRSVVSTSKDNATDDFHPRDVRSVARMPNPMATAIKAIAEAAEDVRKVRIGNVFDRPSRGVAVEERTGHVSPVREPTVQDPSYGSWDLYDREPQRFVHMGKDGSQHDNVLMRDSSTGLASVYASDNEGYNNENVKSRRVMSARETGTSGGSKIDDSLMVQYSVSQNTDDMIHQSRRKDDDEPVSEAKAKHKIVNISVNVNTWKSPHYPSSRDMVELETQKSTLKDDAVADISNARVMKENSNPVTTIAHGKPAAVTQKANQNTVVSSVPGTFPAARPLEDADLRTIFVNNVHFAATKDALSRHFIKFGEVLKVIILTDAATGHPKGSAYVEFMRKEAAENALSMDGTSFMSRIIKVVKKSSAQEETSPTVMWPRITRGSPFGGPRYAQAPFPRVFPGSFRARPPIKVGARSMQWKRDGHQNPPESVASVSANTGNAAIAGRGLTYVRSELKSNGTTLGDA